LSEDSASEPFSGFMPMIGHVNISEEISMINTGGDLLSGHVITIKTTNGDTQIYSMSSYDLMRLYFLISKVVSSN